jgi:hypothetical protein
MRKHSKILLVILMTALIWQAGAAAYAAVSGEEETQSSAGEEEVFISQEVLDQIQQYDADRYNENVAQYKEMLTALDVHDLHKLEIEKLILEAHPLPNILISYKFLYESFGLISELQPMVSQRSTEHTWEDIFKAYHATHPVFVPRNFESEELERLRSIPSLTSDDIMLADQVSFVTGKNFDEVLNARLNGLHWKLITAGEGILYSSDTLPTVQITIEQIDRYTGEAGMTEDQVVEAFVLAYKAGIEPKTVIERLQAGVSREAIMAEAYLAKYE